MHPYLTISTMNQSLNKYKLFIGEASRVRVRCAWKKFRKLSQVLTARGVFLTLKGTIYSACLRSSMIYGSETRPMKVEDKQRLERAERTMVTHMCGVTLKDKKSSEELRKRLGIDSVRCNK